MTNGQIRVIIENVQPQVDGGLYPAKRTIGERVDVTADIFGDGHDHLRAHLLYRKRGAADWTTGEMLPSYNDAWHGSFTVSEKGYYEFTVIAWIDHFDTWYDGFKKKAAANVNVTTELMEGNLFLQQLSKGNNNELLHAAGRLEQEYSKAIEYVLSDDFKDLVHRYPLIMHEARYPKVFQVYVEHKKANYSTWYELFPRSASLDGKHGTFKDVT